MIENLANYCYQLVDVNKDILDLKKYDRNHIFLMDNLNKYIASQPKFQKELNVLKTIYEQHNYISIDNIIDILDKNIIELNTIYKDYVHIVVLTENTYPYKSNFFFYLYFLKRYREITGNNIQYLYSDIRDILNYNNISYLTFNTNMNNIHKNDRNYLLIYCDDFSYSGSQLSNSFSDYDDYKYTTKINLANNINIYLNIIGALSTATNLFKKLVDKIIIPRESIKINNNIVDILLKLSTNEDMNYDNVKKIPAEIIDKIFNFILENDIYKITEKDDTILISRGELGDIYYNNIVKPLNCNIKLSLTYLDFKFPDLVSTLDTFCKLKVIDNNSKYLNYDDFSDKKILEKLYKENNVELSKKNIITKKSDKIPDDLKFIDSQKQYLQLINNFDVSATDIDKYIIDKKDNLICNHSSIKPFYKLLKYKNIIDDLECGQSNSINELYLYAKTKLLEKKCTESTNKYHKYKNKYLKTKI